MGDIAFNEERRTAKIWRDIEEIWHHLMDKRFTTEKTNLERICMGEKKMLEDIFHVSLYNMVPALEREEKHTSTKTQGEYNESNRATRAVKTTTS